MQNETSVLISALNHKRRTTLNVALCLSEKHLSDVEPYLSFLFFSHKNDSHLSWWGIHCLPNALNQSVVWSALFPWWRELMQSKCSHQILQQPLPVLVSAFRPLLHPQSYLCTSSEHVPCLLKCKDREIFSQFHCQIIPPVENAWLQYRPVSLALWKYHSSPTTKIKNSDSKLFSSKIDLFHMRKKKGGFVAHRANICLCWMR